MSVVCIYGIAPISIEGELIFLEEDPEAFKAFVPTDKTHAYLIERGNEEQIFKEIAWKFLFVPVSYHTTGSSRELEIFAAFEEIRTGVHLVASDFSDFGKKVFANVVKNMERLPHSYDGSRWFGSFKNVPAIICAAGPSFAKNSAYLKTLTERALLIGGGSALNVLAHAGIVPSYCRQHRPRSSSRSLGRADRARYPFFLSPPRLLLSFSAGARPHVLGQRCRSASCGKVVL